MYCAKVNYLGCMNLNVNVAYYGTCTLVKTALLACCNDVMVTEVCFGLFYYMNTRGTI